MISIKSLLRRHLLPDPWRVTDPPKDGSLIVGLWSNCPYVAYWSEFYRAWRPAEGGPDYFFDDPRQWMPIQIPGQGALPWSNK